MIGQNTDKNDPFEEFEFRPINEGLGFHRKNSKSGSTSTSSTAAPLSSMSTATPLAAKTKTVGSSTLRASTPSAPMSPFQTPLPRHENLKKPAVQIPTVEDDSIAKAQTAVNEILKTLNQKRQLEFATETEKQKTLLKKSKPQLFAAVLDGMLIVAAFLMTLILMLSITKVDMIMNLTHSKTSGLVYLSTISLLLGVAFIYMVVNRTFLGYTPGEWAFDQQCGRDEDHNTMAYIPKVMLRTLVVMATGFITLPFLSYLFNKDIAGNLTGVALFKKPTGF